MAEEILNTINGFLVVTLFFDIKGVPLIVALLCIGAVFFTLRFGFINIRGFLHSINIIRGKYDDPSQKGEISHFQALTSALSATVGLGNIAGVAAAISLGGPGAVFWMLVVALFGMSSKFISCTLAQIYRKENPDGSISGGPMFYISMGFAAKGLKPIGVVLAIIYAIFVIGGSFGGGCMFQANQCAKQLEQVLGKSESAGMISSVTMSVVLVVLVAIVIMGGIKRIGAVTSKMVPVMCVIYFIAANYILLTNLSEIPGVIMEIISQAFSPKAVEGGLVGVIVLGAKRAVFSSEAGLGSAAIAHAAAKTNEPVREGLVAMIGPFIDTWIVCLSTACAIVISGKYMDTGGLAGVELTSSSFEHFIPGFQYLLAIIVMVYAYSTMISWSYYGQKAMAYLTGGEEKVAVTRAYQVVFLGFIVWGCFTPLGAVLDFSDLLLLSMAFPNIIGCIFLSGEVARALKDYWSRYKSGEMKTYS